MQYVVPDERQGSTNHENYQTEVEPRDMLTAIHGS